MQIYRIEVRLKRGLPDPRGSSLVKDMHYLGITTVSDVRVVDIYLLDADLTPENLDFICRNLLSDSVTQEYSCDQSFQDEAKTGTKCHSVEIAYNAGVTEPIENTVMKAIKDLGMESVRAVKTAKRYLIEGELNEHQLESISTGLLLNPVIHHVLKPGESKFPGVQYRLPLVNEERILELDIANR